ncbi:MAG: hypothetical protein GY716_17785 [bacterium]|nr:hypothetical protein [bacterium]
MEPSLATAKASEPLFSVRANFLLAFFGGIYASAILCSLNSKRAGRLARDVWIPIVVCVAYSAFIVWYGRAFFTETLPDLGEWLTPKEAARYLARIVALGMFGVMYLRLREHFKVQALNGIEPPNPWPWALGSIGISIVLSIALFGIGWALSVE